jgi:HlyD family secretion protein
MKACVKVLVLCVTPAFLALAQTPVSAERAAPRTASAAGAAASPSGIAALARIEPETAILRVAAPYSNGHPSIVVDLLVHEGEQVQKDQLLAVLDGRPELEASLKQAEARVVVAQRALDQVKAGPRPSDLKAQEAVISRLEVSLQNARSDYARTQKLAQTHDASAAEVDAQAANVSALEKSIDEAKDRLAAMSQVRPADVHRAEADLELSRRDIERIKVDIEHRQVMSPAAGRILKIIAHAGEFAGPDGLVELASLSKMVAVAEVYESDIGRVRLGQAATINGEILRAPQTGHVVHIDTRVGRTELVSSDPMTFNDSRAVKVKIRFDDPKPVENLIYGKVSVVIHP